MKLTYSDFVRPRDGLRHELIDGVHYVTPSPAVVHQRLVGRLHGALFKYFEARQFGEVFVAPLDIVLSPHDVVEPDLLVVLADQSDILTPLNIRGAPAIVIEVLSPGTGARDHGIKRNLYSQAGVQGAGSWTLALDGYPVHPRRLWCAHHRWRVAPLVRCDSDIRHSSGLRAVARESVSLDARPR